MFAFEADKSAFWQKFYKTQWVKIFEFQLIRNQLHYIDINKLHFATTNLDIYDVTFAFMNQNQATR